MNVIPPGGYAYVQPETGMRFDGNTTFRPQCRLILSHRKGNGLPRATLAEVTEDLMSHTCERVPGVCVSSEPAVFNERFNIRILEAISPGVTRVTKRCGTCGGRRKK